MQYNTIRKSLHVKEYGRNIQNMVDKLCEIEDEELRLKMAIQTVEILRGMSNQYKFSDSSEQKIWDMLYYISDFKLKVQSPFPPPPQDNFQFNPTPMPYTQIRHAKKDTHLGKNLLSLIKIASTKDNEEEKQYLIRLIAHYIRVAHLTWQNELPNDEYVKNLIHQLSGGKLDYDISTAPKGNHYAQIIQQQKTSKHPPHSKKRRAR